MTPPNPCPLCDDSGWVSAICPHCNGSGEGRHDGAMCWACRGEGEKMVMCPECKGQAAQEAAENASADEDQ
jgi:DnaJ-class molecular chaperone